MIVKRNGYLRMKRVFDVSGGCCADAGSTASPSNANADVICDNFNLISSSAPMEGSYLFPFRFVRGHRVGYWTRPFQLFVKGNVSGP